MHQQTQQTQQTQFIIHLDTLHIGLWVSWRSTPHVFLPEEHPMESSQLLQPGALPSHRAV